MVLDRRDPEQLYSLQRPTKSELEVGWLCRQIIHSLVIQIFLEEDSTTSVIFVSDFDRGKHLRGIRFDVVADLLDYVGRENIIDY
ncbi:hypothetical protein BFL35_06385 [Clavibacter michiganensis]|nr:hypothetical protein BFL35_06385 [Clavibacter michiganensis]